MNVALDGATVVAVGKWEDREFILQIALGAGSEEEQRGEIFEAIANYSEQLEMMDDSIDMLRIEWKVN